MMIALGLRAAFLGSLVMGRDILLSLNDYNSCFVNPRIVDLGGSLGG